MADDTVVTKQWFETNTDGVWVTTIPDFSFETRNVYTYYAKIQRHINPFSTPSESCAGTKCGRSIKLDKDGHIQRMRFA